MAVINTNVASLNAQRNLMSSQSSLATSLQRLSSGLRINSAKDDAAGLAISQRMSAQINGLNQAEHNANDGISLAQTAEGALSGITDMLQRMRTLAVQSANSTNTASDRAALQQEVSQMQQEINRVANTTQFNGLNLLDGSLTSAQFQVGANANQTITASISSAQATAIGNNTLVASNTAGSMVNAISGTATGVILASDVAGGTITIQGNGATSGALTITGGLVSGSAYSIAATVNGASGTTGVSATANTSATLDFSGVTAGSISLILQGSPPAGSTTPTAVTVNATMSSTTDVAGLTAAINAQTGSTGISAVANTSNGTIALTQAQGYDIAIKNNSVGTAATGLKITGQATATGGSGVAVTMASVGVAGDTATVGGLVSYNSSGAFSVTGSTTVLMRTTTAQSSQLSAVASIDVSTVSGGLPTGANAAIQVIDSALGAINASRASLGALQNRFTSTVASLAQTSENLSAARSRILDADFAAESANLTRGQILQQAGTAMLAQANALPNIVMSLLK